MRIDQLLHRLRFCKTRGVAQRLIDEGHLRCNGVRITRASQEIAAGDILAFPLGREVRVIEVLALPIRRGPAQEAQSHYRRLDQGATSALGGKKAPEHQGDERS